MWECLRTICFVGITWYAVVGTCGQAASPADAILPVTTKAFLSTDTLTEVRAAWNTTSLGKMFAGPELKPFMDELDQRNNAADAGRVPPLGLWWDDVLAMSSDSVSLAIVPDARGQSAFVILVDVANHADEVLKVRERLKTDFAGKKARTGALDVAGTKVSIFQYKLGDKPEDPLETRYYFEKEGVLVVTEREFIVRDLLARWGAAKGDALANSPGYKATTVALAAGKPPGEKADTVRIFLDPFGLHAMRSQPVAAAAAQAAGAAKLAAKPAVKPDIFDQLAEQGFKAIEAIGGVATFATGGQDVTFQLAIHAPGKLDRAAQLLALEPALKLDPPEWFPASLASVTSINWKLPAAFAGYGAWFDATDGLGDVGTFDAILEDIKLDKHAPKVDIRKNVVGILTGPVHAATMVDETAIDAPAEGKPRSHWAYVVKTTDEALLAESLRKMLSGDEDILKPVAKLAGVEVWVYRPDGKKTWLGPNLSNVAMTVQRGHWLLASDLATLKGVLAPQQPSVTLSKDGVWGGALAAAKAMHAEPAALRQFRRLDLSLAETYSMLKAGQIQEDDSLLGQALTAWLDQLVPRRKPVEKPASAPMGAAASPPPPHDLDFKKLPNFSELQKYLGSFVAETEITRQGWQQGGLIIPPAKSSP